MSAPDDPYRPPKAALDAATDAPVANAPTLAHPLPADAEGLHVTWVQLPFDSLHAVLQRYRNDWRLPFRLVLPVLLFVLLLPGITFDHRVLYLLAVPLLALVQPLYAAAIGVLVWLSRRRRGDAAAQFDVPTTVQLQSGGVCLWTSLQLVRLRWEAVTTATDGNLTVLINTSNGWRLSIPARAFASPAQRAAFVAQLQAHAQRASTAHGD